MDAIYLHNLSGVLETAIRATNAQFEEPDILKRLDVRLLEVSPGDSGWDVFSLDYHVDGPIGTVIILSLKLFPSPSPTKNVQSSIEISDFHTSLHVAVSAAVQRIMAVQAHGVHPSGLVAGTDVLFATPQGATRQIIILFLFIWSEF